MTDKEPCSVCGARTPVSVEGLCANCLVQIGLEATDESLHTGSSNVDRTDARGSEPEARNLEGQISREDSSEAEESTLSEPPHPPAERIGPYKILELLGQGGMGEVYLAEQVEPIRRRAALKVIKAGMDTRRVIARFESERQALALMNHPFHCPGLRCRSHSPGTSLLRHGVRPRFSHH